MSDIAPGWPCALLPAVPPSVADALSAPTGEAILPQLLQLTPRGAAWGTDEAGSGRGAEPVMLGVWRALAAHAAAEYAIDFQLAAQCFPSAITWSLPDWEDELGLPDSCNTGGAGTEQRIAAVRARFGAIGGQSPAYFVCLAASLGYDVTIEEPGQFHCDDGECVGADIFEGAFACDDGACVGEDSGHGDGTTVDPDPAIIVDCLEYFILDTDPDPGSSDDEVSDGTVWKFWIVHVARLGDTWFFCDEGECDADPLEGFLPAPDLECVFRRLCPPHTELVFNYSGILLPNALLTQDGMPIITEDGAVLVAS